MTGLARWLWRHRPVLTTAARRREALGLAYDNGFAAAVPPGINPWSWAATLRCPGAEGPER